VATALRKIERLRDSIAPFLAFFNGPFAKLNANPEVANFAVGNPQDFPMPEYVEALRTQLEPRRRDWFAYKDSEPRSQVVVARGLSERTGMKWDPADVAMTNGGFAALAVAMRALVEPGDEVIFLSPPWFFYEFMILAADAVPVRLHLAPPAFEPDLEEIAAAITPRTRAIIFNSPHNPSGRVYPLETLQALATTLSDASARIGHPNATWGRTHGNPVHDDIRAVASVCPPDFSFDVILNREQRVIEAFAGEMLEMHATACEAAKGYAMQRVDALFDVVVTSNSGFPLDQNLYQSVKGMSAAAKIVKPGGLIVFHISNRNLDLSPVVADLANSRQLSYLSMRDMTQPQLNGRDPSHWVVLARNRADLGSLVNDSYVQPLSGSGGRNVWTDDFSNIISVFKWSEEPAR